MQLLDVPPEVFQRVVEIYVTTVGIRKAAKAREVSKTFLSYINDEIFARQPTSKLRAAAPKKLVQKNFAFFLERRINAQHGAPDLLPSLILQIAEYLSNATKSESDETSSSWTTKVVSVVTKHSLVALNAALATTSKREQDYKADPTSSLALAVAIYLDDDALVVELLKLEVDPYVKTHLFGDDAIHLASRLKATHLVRHILTASTDVNGERDRKSRSECICDCISLTLRDDNENLAVELLDWHAQHLSKPSSAWSGTLVQDAVAHDASSFVQAMQTNGFLDRKKYPRTQDIINGLLKNPRPQAMLRLFDLAGFINPHGLYRKHRNDEARALIGLAVHHDHVKLAEAIFSTCPMTSYGCGEAFRVAISRNQLPMVKLFLKNGVDPEAVPGFHSPKQLKSTCELARPGSKVYRKVREAVEKKVRQQGPTYLAPVHLVWDPKKQKDVEMRYTFHAPKLQSFQYRQKATS